MKSTSLIVSIQIGHDVSDSSSFTLAILDFFWAESLFSSFSLSNLRLTELISDCGTFCWAVLVAGNVSLFNLADSLEYSWNSSTLKKLPNLTTSSSYNTLYRLNVNSKQHVKECFFFKKESEIIYLEVIFCLRVNALERSLDRALSCYRDAWTS